MIWLAAGAATVCVMTACWMGYGWFARAIVHYRQVYTDEAGARLDEVFLFLDPRQLWGANLLLCGAFAAAVYAATAAVLPALAAAALPVRLPHTLIAIMRRRRQCRFEGQLPDTLLALAAALRAGSSLPGALRHVVSHCDAPLSQEFGLMLREQRLGLSFDAALSNLRARMPTEAVGLVVSALRISAQTGGNLSEALERIAGVLRTRIQLQGRIRTLTAQGRLQAWIVGALAPLLALVLNVLEPESMAPLWHTAQGWTVLAVVIMLETAGVLWIRSIVNIDI
jgi:tight adherence protein B